MDSGKKNIVLMRYGSLEFRKCTYLGQEPDVPGWEIVKYYPNPYFGKEHEYEDHGVFYKPKDNPNHSIDKNIFKHKEMCYSIAMWRWNQRNSEYVFEFVGSRPLDLSDEERSWFWKVYKHGEEQLNSVYENGE